MSTLKVNTIQNTNGDTVMTLTNGHLELPAGSAAQAPIDFDGSGALVTTPIGGAIEYDGKVFYISPEASNRGVAAVEYAIILTGTNTLTSQTGAQPIFDGGGGPAGGALTLPVGTYMFECSFSLTNLSATSGSFGFALGGTATKTEAWNSFAQKAAAAGATATATTIFATAADTDITGSTTTTTGAAYIKGVFRITVAGTIIPQVSMSVANAAVVGANSFFICKPLGASGFVSVGQWA